MASENICLPTTARERFEWVALLNASCMESGAVAARAAFADIPLKRRAALPSGGAKWQSYSVRIVAVMILPVKESAQKRTTIGMGLLPSQQSFYGGL
ncbi:MAG: hypothetical protein BroJett039_05640 [Chloroflexota bacterium]|nr:MAG: hypothetical protein BroJett039_05640 [Chloroflexota bacterium]